MRYIMNFLKKFFGKILKGAKSYIFLSASFVIILSILIWRYGPKLEVAGYVPFEAPINRLVAIMVIVVLWGINNLFVRRKAPVKKEMPKPPEPVRDPNRERVDAFEAGFHGAMKKFQTNWQGGGFRSSSLNALPWYVMLGFTGSGKTTLVAEADLKFPLAHLFGQENFKRVEPTKDVDYWITDNAVLFDLSGELTSQQKSSPSDAIVDVSREIWQKFHALLNKYRPRRPINGVVLCVDIKEFMQSSDEIRSNRAALIHARLVEMSEALGTRYTVHVVLTKMDHLDGFQTYFNNLNAKEREKPFGFSFGTYKEYEGSRWVDEFQAAYDGFVERINNDLIDHLSLSRDAESRRKVYTFARQLTGLRGAIKEFLKDALHENLFSTPPLMRGVYFSSTRQEGVPINGLTLASSVEHDMRWPVLPAHSGSSKPYFSSQLLSNAVFREAGLAGDNNRVERAKRTAVAASILVGSLASVSVWAFYNTSFKDNQKRSGQVLAIAQDFVDQEQRLKNDKKLAGSSWVESLNAISSAVNIFPDFQSKSEIWPYATLYQGKTLGPEVEAAYVKVLNKRFLPDVAEYVHSNIEKLGNNKSSSNSDKRLEALRVYLMLGDKTKRDQKTVSNWLAKNWQSMHEGDRKIQSDLERHLNYAIGPAELQAPLDDKLVLTSQKDLKKIPRALRLYRNIEQIAARQLVKRISFRNEIGPAFNIVMEPIDVRRIERAPGLLLPHDDGPPDLSLTSFFSTPSYLKFFVPQNDSLSVVAVEDAWVTGERDQVVYSSEDLLSFKKKVLGYYTGNYIKSWTAALNALEITDFDTVEHGVQILEELTGPGKPVERLLGLVKRNTEIYQQETVELNKDQARETELPFDDYREQGLRISRSFERLNAIITPAKEGEKAYIEDLLTALVNLHAYMSEIPLAGDRAGQVALEKSKARVKLQGDDPIYVLERLASDLPEPLNRFFLKIADQSWKVILEASRRELQRAWNDEIYTQFNLEMASKFPFKKNALKEVPLKDFAQFFGPEGLVDSFYNNNLVLFIEETTGEPKKISGRFLQVDPQFVKQLQNSFFVKKAFFNDDGKLSLRYSIEPKAMSGSLSRALLNIEGQLVPYSHGPRRPIQILWPNIVSGKPVSQLSVFSSTRNKPATIQYSGEWSGIRLLASGRFKSNSAPKKEVIFSIGGRRVSYWVRAAHAKSTFLTQSLQNLALPAKL